MTARTPSDIDMLETNELRDAEDELEKGIINALDAPKVLLVLKYFTSYFHLID